MATPAENGKELWILASRPPHPPWNSPWCLALSEKVWQARFSVWTHVLTS